MKKYFLLFAAISTGALAFGQQLQTSSLYDLQGSIFNPSAAGVQKNGMAGVTYRSQWSGISGSPKTATAFGSFALPNHNFGLGGYIYNDQTGPTSRTGINLAFAKHIPLQKGTFSVGLETKLQQYRIDGAKLSESLGADPALAGGNNKITFDAGFGVSYTSSNFQVGISVAQLVQSKLDFYKGTGLPRSEEAKLYRHYYGHASYKWQVDDATTISPYGLFIYLPNAPLEFQGGARVEHMNLFWWGLGLRARQSWMLSAGLHISKELSLGYSYEIYNSPLSVYYQGSGAHEILLRYDFLK